MNNKIKNAFDRIHAEDELKNSTIEYINSKRKIRSFSYKKFVPALAAFIFVLAACIFGYKIYNTTTEIISIDVNPSLELGINRFDKVISVTGYNQDGIELAQKIDVQNLNYKVAVEKILSIDFSADSLFSVTVAGRDSKRKNNVLSNLESISVEDKVLVDSATEEEVKCAHEVGMSFGKYKAYKKLSELNNEITTDEIKDMSMRDIHNRLNDLENQKHNQGKPSEDENGKSEHDNKNDSPHSNEQNGNHQNGKEDSTSSDSNANQNQQSGSHQNGKEDSASSDSNANQNQQNGSHQNGKEEKTT